MTIKINLETLILDPHPDGVQALILRGYTPQDLAERLKQENISWNEFAELSMGSTGVVTEAGEFLTYSYDVDRFIRSIKEQKPTYFD